MPKITQPVGGRSGVRSQICPLQAQHLFCPTLLPPSWDSPAPAFSASSDPQPSFWKLLGRPQESRESGVGTDV